MTLRSSRRETGFTFADKEIGYQGVRRGDLVIHAMDAFAGAIGVSDSDGKSSPVYTVCEPIPGSADAKYLAYCLREIAQRGYIQALAKGIRERSTDFRWTQAGDVSIPLPDLEEQRRIAAFLDYETAAIDELVNEQERLQSLLAEKWEATTARIVQAGLSDAVEMAPTGLEWWAVAPAHWKVVPVRALARPGHKTFTDGDWIESPHITDEGVRLLQTGNIGVGRYVEQGGRYISEASFKALRCTEIVPGDVLICRLAAPVGRACLAPDLGVRMITSVDVCILKTHDGVSPAYMTYVMSSRPYLEAMAASMRGGTRDRVSRSFLGAFRIVLPPRTEQDQIASHLDAQLGELDGLTLASQEAASLLRERRSALITAAVTGQIDVSSWRPPDDGPIPEPA